MSARESRPVWETGGDQPTIGQSFPWTPARRLFLAQKPLDMRALTL